MEQEQRFLDLLQNVRTYNLEEQLLLQTEDGRGLLFAAQ
jgi:heat shock protein HslJ